MQYKSVARVGLIVKCMIKEMKTFGVGFTFIETN